MAKQVGDGRAVATEADRMKSPPIPGWLIVDEQDNPAIWFRTREEARQVAKESGLSPQCVMRESDDV